MALFSSRERCFSLRWIRGIRAIRRRACVSLRRGTSGSWACDALAQKTEGRTLSNSLLQITQRSNIGQPADQYSFAHPPSTSPKHTPLLQSTSPAPSERAIKSVFCTANLPTIMYFFSVISPRSGVDPSANPHTTHYNTDDFQVTPTIYEATYRPNLIL